VIASPGVKGGRSGPWKCFWFGFAAS